MNLNKWFDKGLTIDQYKSAQQKHDEAFTHILDEFTIEEDESFFNSLKEKNLRVVAIVEEWCGHCMLNVPLLIHLANKTNMSVRFLPRDDNLDLMEHYLTNDKRIIPIFVFIDEDGNEVFKWGPVAEEIQDYVAQFRKDLPERDTPEYEEAFQTFIKQVGDAFETNETLWQASYNDIKQTIVQNL